MQRLLSEQALPEVVLGIELGAGLDEQLYRARMPTSRRKHKCRVPPAAPKPATQMSAVRPCLAAHRIGPNVSRRLATGASPSKRGYTQPAATVLGENESAVVRTFRPDSQPG